MQITFSIKLQHQQPHPKVAESENVRANHLEFMKSLFQHYCQYLRLTHNHILAESAFNFYVNEKIAYLLGTSVNIESVRETFYNKLIQNTSLPTNHNFAFIITEINKEIEHYTQQRYPIMYTRLYGKYFKGFKSQSPTPSRFRSPPPQPNFGTANPWEITESEGEQEVEEEEESENHEFTYQNPILENPESKTLNFQTQPNLDNQENNIPNIQTPPNQNNPNPKVINQYLSSVIVINQPPIEPIGQSIQPQNQQNQQLPPVPPQQQQQLSLL
ncbi:hypothetical protein G9A89_009289 [Geosiphon pyriformis]|nr:hypothetical protein G9A89_009289 [Geosiphon pyriformis]